MIDGPSMIKDSLWLNIPEAKANTREMKCKLRTVSITAHKVDASEMMQHIEELCNDVLSEVESYQDFCICILSALAAFQENSFLHALETAQDLHDSSEAITNVSNIR